MILSSYVYCYLVQKIPFQLDGWQAVKNDYNANLRPAISLCFICMVLVPEVQKILDMSVSIAVGCLLGGQLATA